jgi:hypothetical protein
MEDRRKVRDRRSFRPTPAFPFTDTRGCFLRDCRSTIPDRRLNSLQAEWLSMALVRAHFVTMRESIAGGELVEGVPLPLNIQGNIA